MPGSGRRTFAKRLYKDVYPAVNTVFPEIRIEGLDGLYEIYRKLDEVISPISTLSALRARILGFSIANDNEKASQIVRLLEQLLESREAILIYDHGGLLDDAGAIQAPIGSILARMRTYRHPPITFIAERMIPQGHRLDHEAIAYCSLPSLSRAEVRQLAAILLKSSNIEYSNDDLDQIIDLSDGHPFNVRFIIEAAKQYTLRVFLADTSEFPQWKKKRGSEFIQRITFSDDERKILSGLRDFNVLDFATIQAITGRDIATVGRALARLMDYHIIEASGDSYQVSPPLRVAIERDARFAFAATVQRQILAIVAGALNARDEGSEISVSMVNAGILANLQKDGQVPELFAAFLLPSHLVWLARRRYDDRQFDECTRLALSALDGIGRLSPAGKVEACRILCLASARLGREENFNKGIAVLRNEANDPWGRSNINFLLGFNARLKGNLPQAEAFFRESYRDSPGNFSTARELASICMIRGDLESAEAFARRAFATAHDNAYILDILLGVLIKSPGRRRAEVEQEIALLFEKLEQVGEEQGRSFYTTRRAEYELKNDRVSEACRLIDEAARKTPGIFNVHALRAQIYLERGIKTVAWDEIEKMRNMVYRESGTERRSNLRPLLEIEASYHVLNRDYDAAKEIYRTEGVFTKEEAEAAVKSIEYEQAFRRR